MEKTPVQAWLDNRLHMANIQICRSNAFTKVVKPMKKIDSRPGKLVMMGYCKFFDETKRKIGIDRHVKFKTKKNK